MREIGYFFISTIAKMQAIPEWLGAYNLPSIGNMPIMIEAKGALLWSLLCGGFQSQNAKTCLCKSIYCTYNRFVSQKQMFSVFRFYMQHSLFRLYSCFLSCSQAMLACAENNVEGRGKTTTTNVANWSLHFIFTFHNIRLKFNIGLGVVSSLPGNAMLTNQPPLPPLPPPLLAVCIAHTSAPSKFHIHNQTIYPNKRFYFASIVASVDIGWLQNLWHKIYSV